MKYKILMIVLLCLLLTSCKQYYTEDAWLRDTLFSVEVTKNGYCRIWMTHDDVSTYCSGDKEICAYATSLLQEHQGEVMVHFFEIEVGDEAAGHLLQMNVCGQGIYETKVWGFDQILPAEGR